MAKASTKNHKHFINSSELLSMIVGMSKEEGYDYLIKFHQELIRDNELTATNELAIEIITEGHGFRNNRSEAGKRGAAVRYAKEEAVEYDAVGNAIFPP